MLDSQASHDSDQENLGTGHQLMALLSLPGPSRTICESVLPLLAQHHTQDTRIQGLRPLPWLALRSRVLTDHPELKGWGLDIKGASDRVRQMRTLRRLSQTDPSRPLWTDLERWCVVSGLLAQAEETGGVGTRAEQDQFHHSIVQARSLKAGSLDAVSVLREGLPGLADDLAVRLATNSILARRTLQAEEGWAVVKECLPALFEGVVPRVGPSLLTDLFSKMSIINIDWVWDGELSASRYQQGVQVWLESWGDERPTPLRYPRQEWMDALRQALARSPGVLLELCALGWEDHVSGAIEHHPHHDAMMKQWQGHRALLRSAALDTRWEPSAPARPGLKRM